MANRFYSPNQQFCDGTGLHHMPVALLPSMRRGHRRLLRPIRIRRLRSPNTNPVVLDSAGRAGNIFLQNLAYKVVLSDVNSNPSSGPTIRSIPRIIQPGPSCFPVPGARTVTTAGTAGSDRRSALIPIGTPPITSSMFAPRPAPHPQRSGRLLMPLLPLPSFRSHKDT
jgi:hypothetical protein